MTTPATARYALFANSTYYPLGGWADYQAGGDDPEALVPTAAEAADKGWDWFQVVDLAAGAIVLGSWAGHHPQRLTAFRADPAADPGG